MFNSMLTLLQAHREREKEKDKFNVNDKEQFITASYRKKLEELEADEKKEEEYEGKH